MTSGRLSAVVGLLSVLMGASGGGRFVSAAPRRYEFRQRAMGTEIRLVLYAPQEAPANAAAKAVFARIRQLDAIFSDYRTDSELMRLCAASRPGHAVRVSPELWTVLQKADEIARLSGGAFDVTVGHLTRLWRRARRRKQLPDPRELRAALAKTGYRLLRFHPQQRAVELLKPDMRLDVGGIAKGYAGDEALKVLKRHGLSRALIDVGGDLVLGDPPPGKTGWVIAVASLRHPEGHPARYLRLSRRAVATSGDAYQYVVLHGRRYSHILDPKTGLGLSQRSSVTVIARTGIEADALASALSVLGPQRGLKLVTERKDAEALLALLKNGRLQTFTTCGFRRYIFSASSGAK